MKRLFYAVLAAVALLTASRAAVSGGPSGAIVKGPWMQHVTSTSAVVQVEVDPPAAVTLEIGMAAATGTADAGTGSVVESREVRALHAILVRNLEPATRYPFAVRVRGAAKYGAITTAPRDDSTAPVRFLVYGDSRTDDAAHAALVRAMAVAPSAFLVGTGDLVDKGASAPEWQTFFDIEAPLLRERCLFSAVGNHELVDGAGALYVKYFGPAELPVAVPKPATSSLGAVPLAAPQAPADAGGAPFSLEQLSGTFRWGNVRFFLLNGMVDYASGPARAWIEKALTDADEEAGLVWRILVVHHGPWSSGPHGGNAHLLDAAMPAVFKAHRIDLVISGHDHIYERGAADGLAYLVSGGGGAPVYRVKKAGPTSRHYESVHHFIDATATASAIQLLAIRPDGSTIERCALRKVGGWDCDAPDLATATGGSSAGGSSTLPPEAPVSSRSRCGCDVVGAGPTSVAAVALGGAAVVALRRRRRARGEVRSRV